MQKEMLGIDIGGVIIDRVNDNTDTSFFGKNFLQTTAVPEAFETLKCLVNRFNGNVHLVSKCGPAVEMKTLQWFEHHHFYEQTGVSRTNLHYCRERKAKAGICMRLGITHFIDDRLEVLGYLKTVPNLYLFQPQEKEIARNIRHLRKVRRVDSWEDVRRKLLRE